MSMLSILTRRIKTHGPIPTARVSSAQAQGAARNWRYLGAVRYEVRLSSGDGVPINVALERASSDRRSERLADRDCAGLCASERRVRLQRIGTLDEKNARDILAGLGDAEVTQAIARHDERDARRSTRWRGLASLSLADRLTVRLAARVWKNSTEEAIVGVRRGTIDRNGRWLSTGERGRLHVGAYIPWGDARDIAEFRDAVNQECRRLIYRACGERVLMEASLTLVHRDDYGTLYDDGMGERIVRVVCPSTAAIYWLPVSRWTSTARAAVAETFGLRAEEYAPAVEA